MTVSHNDMLNVQRSSPPPYIHTQYEHRSKRNMIPGEKHIAENLITESVGFQVLVFPTCNIESD